MEEHLKPFVEQMRGEMEKILEKHFELEHQLIQKDIEIATLTLELGLQKRIHSHLRRSYANLIKHRADNSA